MKRPMNILYIHSHDTGRHISPYGCAVDTPNLQQLAEEGVLFRKAFNAAPTCSPSRACLLTGMAAHSNGMFGLAHLGWRLNDYGQHLIHTLHSAGYTSVLSGIQHIANPPAADTADIGYHEVLTESHDSNEITQQAVSYLRRDHLGCFFMSVGFFETHRPFPAAEEQDDPRYLSLPALIEDTPANRQDMAEFHASVRQLDRSIGRILDALKEAGLDENTLVICTTDHGLAMPEMKCRLTDHGTGVVLIMRGPGGFRGGKVIDSMVSQLDLFPTLCELIGVEKPDWLQGQSILPLLNDSKEEIHDGIFSEINFHTAYEPQRAVRTKRWKYIRRFDRNHTCPVLVNCDDSPAKTQRIAAGWRVHELPEEQLYDLLFDPQECSNLAGSETHQDVLVDLRDRVEQWMRETNDPLLCGAISLPGFYSGWAQTAQSTDEPKTEGAIRQ